MGSQIYPQVYPFIDTFEGQINTLECMVSELQRHNQDKGIQQAIACLNQVRSLLWSYEGKIDPSLEL